MKIVSIVGARLQFIKAAIVSKRLEEFGIEEKMIHTGQHYDYNMYDLFFEDLEIRPPAYNLGIGSGTHGIQTGKMLIEIEKVLLKESPDLVLVYGDTNTTLAGAIAAAKLKIPVGHVEAGLRSYNKAMPEEINRVLTDHISDLLFAPTEIAVNNLKKENILNNVFSVGDVMYDIASIIINKVKPKQQLILDNFKLSKKDFVLVTIHREENTDNKINLFNIFEALKNLANIGYKIFFPIHPRTKKYLDKYKLLENDFNEHLIISEPVSYSEMIVLESSAKVIITDSGGVQKESYFFKTPSVIPRKETEWVELTNSGWNVLTGADKDKIVEAVLYLFNENINREWKSFYGDGDSSYKIAGIIKEII